jgi:hypothetical protein
VTPALSVTDSALTPQAKPAVSAQQIHPTRVEIFIPDDRTAQEDRTRSAQGLAEGPRM